MDASFLNRRQFLRRTAAAAAAGALGPSLAYGASPVADSVLCSFFVVGDTHYHADDKQTDVLSPVSAAVTTGLVGALNQLPGTDFPEKAGGGKVAAPVGVLHVGDLIESGDKTGKQGEAMQLTEWKAYRADFGMTGKEGKLKHPVMDIAGNHDATHDSDFMIQELAARHRTRKGLRAISKNGLHYSWNWGGVHFIALGLIVGADKSVARPRRYASMESLDFLREDLDAHRAKELPIVIMHHVDVARYTTEKEGTDYTKWEWDPADVKAFHGLIKDRRVATFNGHTHARNICRWDGNSTKAKEGVAVFNVDNSGHFNFKAQAFFHVEARQSGLTVREYASPDNWVTADWTPQVWRVGW